MRRYRGFTVLELMVVVGIILLMTALALPAVTTFLRGQRLQQSGRIMQSAFNEARRAAITQRTKQYLIFFRDQDELGQVRYSAQRYRDRHGWEGEPFNLLPAVEIETTPAAAPPGTVARATQLGLPIFGQRPAEDDPALFTDRRPIAGLGWIEFRKDGTINLQTPLANQLPPTGGPFANMFDLNVNIQVNETQLDAQITQVDMSLREAGGGQVQKRCFIDIDPNTGRVRFRVIEGINIATTG